ncbi:tsukushi [Hemiscyllium ocellatum]|uniref:tsukushi n=1 Tax=Hemiscyllium ocellatum TaxID=170820 RepID=UPI0029661FBC|nr:tsukushi [Hemiscyllium ocellatum]XP_060682292.1 tsukushi [Hemiscyllium ocellatum]XP_060682293.1 tsukushi [Hemiscyllium ocellatum]XP_060682294.1 tsukushi [Hemiscyllium ocellatum]
MAYSAWLILVIFLLSCDDGQMTCFPGCHCEVESFGMFSSFSLTKVDCSGVGPQLTGVPIPLDTSYLDLSSNHLKTISPLMFTGPGYTTLVSLDLSYNEIIGMPFNTFSKLRYLETLNLSHNSLEVLEEGIFSNLPLGEIDLSANKLHDINFDIFTSKGHGKPLSVDLSDNRITTVVRSLDKSVPNIYSLDLSENKLESVPTRYLSGVPLRYLYLGHNLISSIPENAFTGLQELTHLSLRNLPRLMELSPNSFKGLQNLQVLDLSSCVNLKFVNVAVFGGLSSLQELYLEKSGVATLSSNILNYLPSIKRISVGTSLMRCGKTAKEGSFHRQFGFVQKEQTLHCLDISGSSDTEYVLKLK